MGIKLTEHDEQHVARHASLATDMMLTAARHRINQNVDLRIGRADHQARFY